MQPGFAGIRAGRKAGGLIRRQHGVVGSRMARTGKRGHRWSSFPLISPRAQMKRQILG